MIQSFKDTAKIVYSDIKAFWEMLPREVKVACYIAAASILAQLQMDLANVAIDNPYGIVFLTAFNNIALVLIQRLNALSGKK